MTPEQRLDAANRHANSALEAVGQRWAGLQTEYMLGGRFDSHLDALAELAEGELLEQARTKEGEAPLFKLVLMAEYRRRHADRIHAIARHFTRPVWKSGRIPPDIAPVTNDWAEAGDRLAWEYLLLRPSARTPYDLFDFMRRANDALAKTSDPATILTYGIMIQSSLTDAARPSELRNRYVRHTLWGMAEIPSSASLIGLLSADEWLREAPRYHGSDGPDAESVSSENSIRRVRNAPLATLRATLWRDSHERWEPAVDEFAEMATPEHKTMLVELMLSTLLDDVVRAHRRKARAAKDESR